MIRRSRLSALCVSVNTLMHRNRDIRLLYVRDKQLLLQTNKTKQSRSPAELMVLISRTLYVTEPVGSNENVVVIFNDHSASIENLEVLSTPIVKPSLPIE